LAAMLMMFLAAGSMAQIAAILFGAAMGLILCRDLPAPPRGHLAFALPRRAGILCLAVFAALLLGLPLLAQATGSHALAVFDAFYRSGALVFGGGHVVLPLLRDAVVTPGWLSPDTFLGGYGAAQAVPGPLFTVSAYLGAAMTGPPNGVAGAAMALVAIFLPGLLVLCGALPFWDRMRGELRALAAMRGINAAVVGILAAALYDPLWIGTVRGWPDIALAIAGFLLLTLFRMPPLFVVLALAATPGHFVPFAGF
jgi:chromate transporter